jgi:hypothetical protein
VELRHARRELRFLVVRFVRLGRSGGVAPGIGLRAGHDARDVRVFITGAVVPTAATSARFGAPNGLFLLFFCPRALTLALAPRQWIPCSHLARIVAFRLSPRLFPDSHTVATPSQTIRAKEIPMTGKLSEIQPRQVTSADEAGDPSAQNAENPTLVREESTNTSDSSGLRVDDEAKGDLIKEQLERGLRGVSPMD